MCPTLCRRTWTPGRQHDDPLWRRAAEGTRHRAHSAPTEQINE